MFLKKLCFFSTLIIMCYEYYGQPIEIDDEENQRLFSPGSFELSKAIPAHQTLVRRSKLPVYPIKPTTAIVPSKNNNLEVAIITGQSQTKLPWYKDQIDKNMDFILPFYDGFGLMVPLIDYSVKEIIDKKGKLKSKNSEFVYINMYLISKYVEYGVVLHDSSKINRMKLKGKILIMPIFHGRNHVVVLIADTKKKVAQYYEPNNPTLTWSRDDGRKRFKRFRLIMEDRNENVENDEEIDMTEWKLIPPKVKIEPQLLQGDCAIFAIKFIDLIINGKSMYRGTIVDYRKSLQNAVIDKILDDDEKINIARKTWFSEW